VHARDYSRVRLIEPGRGLEPVQLRHDDPGYDNRQIVGWSSHCKELDPWEMSEEKVGVEDAAQHVSASASSEAVPSFSNALLCGLQGPRLCPHLHPLLEYNFFDPSRIRVKSSRQVECITHITPFGDDRYLVKSSIGGKPSSMLIQISSLIRFQLRGLRV
jgi:hypothetical protein